MRCRLVHDDAHRALGRMGADIDHAAREAIVAHGGHGDQHLAVEIAALRAPARLRSPRSGPPGLGRYALGHLEIVIGRRGAAVVSHAGLATELHVEMLPDWVPIATMRPLRSYASFVPQFAAAATYSKGAVKICVALMDFARRGSAPSARPLTINSVAGE